MSLTCHMRWEKVLDNLNSMEPTAQNNNPLDLHTYSILRHDDRDQILTGLLQIDVDHDVVVTLLKLPRLGPPDNNAVRYMIGNYLNQALDSFPLLTQHLVWVKDNLGLEEHQDRRYRRHATNVDLRVQEGLPLEDVLKLPALTLRGSKSRKVQAADQRLDALRTLRGDLQEKLVAK